MEINSNIIYKNCKELKEVQDKLNKEKNNNNLLIEILNEEKRKNLDLGNELKEKNEKISILENELIKEINKGKEIELKLLKMSKFEEKIQDKSILENLIKKDEEIEKLKIKLKRFHPFELSEGEKLISVIIQSVDQNVHISLICKNTDKFNMIENKIYEKNDYYKYSELETFYTTNGKKVNKFKSLDENNIHDNDVIIINALDK